MSLLARKYPDPEVLIVDHLTTLLAGHLPAGATVGVGVPGNWRPTSPAHVEVAWDGTPSITHPIVANATVRIVVHAASTGAAKSIALDVQGRLLAGGWPDQFSVKPLTGVLPERDPNTRAELAAFTVQVNARSVPIA